ncbi:MAG: hypothetical protein SF051_08250 [Elusimicrobiota bacterium]|nr:hypothetical protein [Elusimicrobiota bacterium]
MRHAALLLLVALPVSAGPHEAARASGAAAFRAAPAAFVAPEPVPAEPVLQPALVPSPFAPRAGRVRVAGRVALAAQLDKQRALIARQLGARPWDVGVASDAGLRAYYLTFTPASQPGPVTLAPLGDLNRLRGDGVNARVDSATVYNFKVSANIFSPTRGSTLHMRPVAGVSGPSHQTKTGVVLDAVKARAFVFRAGGKEFWLHYGTDVKADGTGFADTRSFLIIHENGLSSKAWPLAESALAPDAAATVDLGGTRVVLTRTSGGELVVAETVR